MAYDVGLRSTRATRERSMGLIIPEAMEAVLQEGDTAAVPLDEVRYAGKLVQAAPEAQTLGQDERRGAFAEIAAWRFMRSHGGEAEREPWGIYWTPLAGGTYADGRAFHSPDVAELDEEILSHWIGRASRATHPAIKARYADLAWEIGRYLKRPSKDRQNSPKPPMSLDIPVALAHAAVDGYLDAIERGLVEDEYDGWVFIDRAIGLSLSLRDRARWTRAKAALFAYYRKVGSGNGKFMWWRLGDILENREKSLELDETEQNTVTESLETALRRHSDVKNAEIFDPHAAQDAADRLAKRLSGHKEQAQRVVKRSGEVFEEIAKQASGIQAITWLEGLIPRYRALGLTEDVARVEQAIRDRAEQARGEMKRVSVPVNIPKDETDKWVESVVGDNPKETLGRIAFFCTTREDNVQNSVQGMMENAPLLSHISATVMGTDGFTEATIDSVEDDLQGRTIQHAADRIGWHAPLLHMVLERAKEKHQLDLEAFVAYISAAPFFAPSREALLREGLTAWFAGDSVKAIHVLVPQFEAACRDLLAALGAPVMRHDPKTGGYEVIGLGAVLHHPFFRKGVDKNIRFHLQVLYSDPRAINLRNDLAHGIANVGVLGIGMANWVVHSILLIASLTLRKRSPDGEAVSAEGGPLKNHHSLNKANRYVSVIDPADNVLRLIPRERLPVPRKDFAR